MASESNQSRDAPFSAKHVLYPLVSTTGRPVAGADHAGKFDAFMPA